MKVQKRRRRENKTDYLKRLKLLKGEIPRVVFRKTNKYIIAQYFLSEEAQDKAIIGIDSRELIEYGWPKEGKGSLKSISASYLTGYLIGKKIVNKKLKNPILDNGMIRIIHKNKVYAFIKGMIDAGIKINCNKEFFPEESRIKGENLKLKIPFNEIKSKIEKL
ncbi:MAG TPA: 50S ribosomal protein L18 [Candidatus Pacearchaeota archaeon]|nr:50S ribosomal protein L18 [Candidatus Pacearchaeota archaeon]